MFCLKQIEMSLGILYHFRNCTEKGSIFCSLQGLKCFNRNADEWTEVVRQVAVVQPGNDKAWV